MSERKVNLEEILNRFAPLSVSVLKDDSKRSIINGMREACRQVLELASENAEWGVCQNDDGQEPWIHESNIFVDKESITNTINQVK